MNTKYTIKNFRVFDNEGVDLDLRPITFLTGCNSSGKSSIVKSLLLLCDFFQDVKNDYENGKKIYLDSYKLDFTRKPHNKLGKYSKVVNYDSKDNTITFEIDVYSKLLFQNVHVELSFDSKNYDNQTNGHLESIIIRKKDGTIFYSSNAKEHNSFNLESLRDDFIKTSKIYLKGIKDQTGIRSFSPICNKLCGNSSFIYESFVEEIIEIIQIMDNQHILFYLPILDKLNGTKEEAISYLFNCFGRENILEYKAFLAIIIENFKKSGFSNFIDFYRNEEQMFLSNYPSNDNSPSLFKSSSSRSNNSSIDIHLVGRLFRSLLDAQEKKDFETIDLSSNDEELKQLIDSFSKDPLCFLDLYAVIDKINNEICKDRFCVPTLPDSDGTSNTISAKFLFSNFVEKVVEEILIDAMPNAIQYVSSSIINVKRLYPLDAEDEFTYLIKKYRDCQKGVSERSKYSPNTFIKKWAQRLGIGKSIDIEVDSEGLGATIRLQKDDNPNHSLLLADNGYGMTQIYAILLNIEIAILKRGNKFYESTIAIEEPEIHLHPSYQSLLAEMFYDAYTTYGVHFIIETHSEYLIRKSQMIVSNEMNYSSNEEAQEKCPFITYYVPTNGKPYSLGYRKDGKFVNDFGTGFYDEASNLAFELF